jgi:DNA-binding NarL/FixJ family response regulator
VKRVLVADDHAVVRAGLKRILAETGDLVVAGEAATVAEVLDRVRDAKYDAVLLDIALPDGDGLTALKELRARGPSPPVLILSMYPEEQFAVRALRAGALGYLTKESAADELVVALRAVVDGKRYITRAVAECIAATLADPLQREPHERLSGRELEVFRMLTEGRRIKEIAARLHLSEKTITTHRRNILDKLELTTNADLIHYAAQHRLFG